MKIYCALKSTSRDVGGTSAFTGCIANFPANLAEIRKHKCKSTQMIANSLVIVAIYRVRSSTCYIRRDKERLSFPPDTFTRLDDASREKRSRSSELRANAIGANQIPRDYIGERTLKKKFFSREKTSLGTHSISHFPVHCYYATSPMHCAEILSRRKRKVADLTKSR